MRFDILTLHPEMCTGPLETSILGRARDRGLIEVRIVDIRDFAPGRHRQADDTPYGGGRGMVMRVDVVAEAIESVRTPTSRVLLMEASGAPFTQAAAAVLSEAAHIILVCGHYEGIDARIREHLVDDVYTIGDYVLTGGELPAMVIVDAISRLIPGVLGSAESAVNESFQGGLLEHPHYTRPREYRGWAVPDALLSGHHAEIERWRHEQAEERTRRLRPDLLEPNCSGSLDTGPERS